MAFYGWPTPFARAIDRKVVRHQNNALNIPNLEPKIEKKLVKQNYGRVARFAKRLKIYKPSGADRNHGICCGLAATWVVNMCLDDSEAYNPNGFDQYFQSMRHGGAQIKSMTDRWDGSTGEQLVIVFASALVRQANFRAVGIPKRTLQLRLRHRPNNTPWAAYVKFPAHAVACAQNAHGHYIFDPNFGLFVYDDATNWKNDFNDLALHFKDHKANRENRPSIRNRRITLYFYAAS